MEEAVEGVVGRLQVKEHLAHLIIIQLIRGRHAAQGGQPVGKMSVRELYDHKHIKDQVLCSHCSASCMDNGTVAPDAKQSFTLHEYGHMGYP